MSQVGSDHITVECACGKRLKAPASAAGRRAKCPKCGAVMTIEAPPPPEADEGEFGLDALYEIAEREKEVAAKQVATPSMRCPSCSSALVPGAVLCVNCGYDLRTKSKLKAKKDAPPPPPVPGAAAQSSNGGGAGWFESAGKKNKDQEDEAGAEGSFVMGIVLGFGLAVLGAAACFGLWYAAPDLPFTGWLVLLVGALAGWGVNRGYKANTHFAGAVAAAITFVLVLAAKGAVLAAFVAPTVSEIVEESKVTRDQRVLDMLVEEEYEKANVDEDAADEEQTKAVRGAARKRLKDMPEPDYLKLVAKADLDEEKDELVPVITEEVLKERNVQGVGPGEDHYELARKEATKRVEAMKPAERKQRLAAAKKAEEAAMSEEEKKFEEEMRKERAEAEKAEAAQPAKSKAADDDDGGGAGSLIGFGIIMVLAFFIWAMLPTFVAMALAWKIAADA